MIAANLGEKPRCPVMLHFGEEDGGIPMSDVDKIKAAVDPAMVQVFTYPGAGHAFNRDGTAAWHGASRHARPRADGRVPAGARRVGRSPFIAARHDVAAA